MRIERVIIHGLRALQSRDDRFMGPDGVFTSACLRGLNGAGKTTYLAAIAEVWQWFRRCTKKRAFVQPAPDSLLRDAKFVGLLVSGLPGPRSRMWLAWGRAEFFREHGLLETPESPFSIGKDGLKWDPTVLEWWDKAYTVAESGGDAVPNVVFIEAEKKYIKRLHPREVDNPMVGPCFLPVVPYTALGSSHVETMLRTLALARRTQWAALIQEFGRLRPGLALMDEFDPKTQRAVFKRSDGVVLPIELLSAGERSVLINLVMLLRWLTRGGILLLDEPELHQHVSLMRGSIAVIETLVVREFDGQLLCASHAAEVWDHFQMSGSLVDLDS